MKKTKIKMNFKTKITQSVTLNDLERHNGRVLCIILPNLVAFCAYHVKVVEDIPIHFVSEV